MSVEIRKTTAADAGIVARYVHALLSELSPGTPFSQSSLEDTARSLLADGAVIALFAVSNGTPVGLITLNECAAIYAGGRFGEISELYVEPDYRSKGVAPALLAAAAAIGNERGWKRLEVGAPNQPAWARTLAFYLREGFLEVGPRLRRPL